MTRLALGVLILALMAAASCAAGDTRALSEQADGKRGGTRSPAAAAPAGPRGPAPAAPQAAPGVAPGAAPGVRASSPLADSEAGNNTNGHKRLVPATPADIGLFVLVVVALFIASGAGVGGGVLLVPALLLVGQFNAIVAVALSNMTILASAIANLIFNAPRRSPLRKGPLIDWSLVLLFGPPTVIGSIAGSYVNMAIPSWVTKVMLFLLLLPMTWRMITKARLLHEKETAARRVQMEVALVASPPHGTPSIASPYAAGSAAMADVAAATTAAEKDTGGGASILARVSAGLERPADVFGPELSCLQEVHPVLAGGGQIMSFSASAATGARVHGDPYGSCAVQLDSDGKHVTADAEQGQSGLARTPASALASGGAAAGGRRRRERRNGCPLPLPLPEPCALDLEMCAAAEARVRHEQAAMLPPLQVGLLVLILVSVAATNVPAGLILQCGTWQYWLAVLSPLPAMLLVSLVARHHVLRTAAWKDALGLRDAGDLRWNTRTTVVYPSACIAAGVIAGLLGLGGGLVLAPLMLELGVHPAVSAASTQVTLLISSSASAIVYAVSGMILWDYCSVLVSSGFAATLLGQWLVTWLTARLGRPSVLVVILALMFSASSLAALAVVVTTAIDMARNPAKLFASKGVCPTFH